MNPNSHSDTFSKEYALHIYLAKNNTLDSAY